MKRVERLRDAWLARWREEVAPRIERLAPRERRLLALVAMLLPALIFIFGIWLPVRDSIAELEHALPAQRAALAEAKTLAGKLSARKAGGQIRAKKLDVLEVVQRAAKETGVRQHITRIKPEPDAGGGQRLLVRVHLAPYPKLVRFLGALARAGAPLNRARLLATDKPGIVDGDLVVAGQ